MIYAFVALFLIGTITFWNYDILIYGSEIDAIWVMTDFAGPFLSILMLLYFKVSGDYRGLSIVSKVAILFIFITAITSIVGLTLFPDAVRELTSSTAGANLDEYGRLGIPSYSYWASMVYLFPIFYYYLRLNGWKIYKKAFLLVLITLVLLALFKAQITTAMMLALFSFIFSIFNFSNLKLAALVIAGLLVLVLFVFNEQIADLFYFVAANVESNLLNSRLMDVGKVFELRDFDPNSGETYFSQERLSRVFLSFESFGLNPIFGGGELGGHSTWVDKLGLFGLMGTIPWLIIYRHQFKTNFRMFNDYYAACYSLAIGSNLILGLLTTTANSVHSSFVIFFIIPSLYYLNYKKFNVTDYY